MSDITVGVRELKARLSDYLRQVKQGQTIIITEHGRPVGRLLPVEQDLEERLKRLQEAGIWSYPTTPERTIYYSWPQAWSETI